MCLLAQLVHHSTELGHAETDVLVLQNVLVFPHHMPGRRGVVMDLQSIRPQIDQPIDGAVGTPDHEPVHHNLHPLQTAPVLWGRAVSTLAAGSGPSTVLPASMGTLAPRAALAWSDTDGTM